MDDFERAERLANRALLLSILGIALSLLGLFARHC
jgi:hypothetical protein